MQDIEMQELLYRILYILDARITELNHPVALGANEVIVLFITIGLLVLREVLSKLVFTYKVAFYKQIEGIVNCGPANPVILVFHADVERLYIEMTVARVDLFKYGITFRCFP